MVRAGIWSVGLIFALALAGSAYGQVADLPGHATPAGNEMRQAHTAAFSAADLHIGLLQGYDTVSLKDGLPFAPPGKPMLPAVTLRIALPLGMAVTRLRVVGADGEALTGEYTVYPAQPPRPMSEPGGLGDFVLPEAATYGSHETYPGELAEYLAETDLAGQAMALVRFYPVQYVPAERKLTFYSAIAIELEGTDGYVCGDYLPARISAVGRAGLEEEVRTLVANPERVSLAVAPAEPPRMMGVSAGSYDYVIVTQDGWVTNFQDFADWKTKRGMRAKIVTTTWIYDEGGYTGTNSDKIRAFIEDAYTNWGATFVLLGGDVETVPARLVNINGDDIPNDAGYGDFDGDWTCEVNVGRAPVRNTTHIATFVGKAFTYEKNPPRTAYAKTAFFCGFDLSQLGAGEGENLMKAIKDLWIPASWTYRWEYDSEPGLHKADSIAKLNLGNHLVNHSDHASTTVMGAGYVNHNELFSDWDLAHLTNGPRYSLWYTLGCWACDYASNTCIGEAFVQNANGGGYAFIGNSRYGWYYPGSSDGASAAFDRAFFRALFQNGKTRLGQAFSYHRDRAYDGSSLAQYIYTELTLLGDPELPLLTEDPQDLTVVHPWSLPSGIAQTVAVQVNSSGYPLRDARVCLWKGSGVYVTGFTDVTGTAWLDIPSTTPGGMYLTVGKRNYVPYATQIWISANTKTLTVETEGAGAVELNPGGGRYVAGTEVWLTATASTHWCLDHWSGALSGIENPTSIVMNADKTVRAIFAPDCNDNGQPDAVDIDTGLSLDVNGSGVPDECEPVGDVNCDGLVNNLDIDHFVQALLNPESYVADHDGAPYPACDLLRADCNGDGAVNSLDINGFVRLLTGR